MTKLPEPTVAMVEFYELRTREHIDRVRRCLRLLAIGSDHSNELLARAQSHDASKFESEERIPYIWLTEYYRCRRIGAPFSYPIGAEALIRQAIDHHVTTNRHHPEFHSDLNDMTEVDLMEMVCDWTAMSQEFQQDGGSARGWADKSIGHRLLFNQVNREFIYRIIDRLDAALVDHPK